MCCGIRGAPGAPPRGTASLGGEPAAGGACNGRATLEYDIVVLHESTIFQEMDMSETALKIVGAYGSPYSRKMRAVLRYRRIPHHRIVRGSREICR